jgi:hypothetical protein
VIKRNNSSTTYSVTSSAGAWKYTLKIKGLAGSKYKVNGKVLTATADEIELNGKMNSIEVFL